MRQFLKTTLTIFALASTMSANVALGERLKDLGFVRGIRDNELVGYGLVVGLRNTGDDINAPMTPQSVTTMLRRLGVQVDPKKLLLRNVAAVMVTGSLAPFSRSGTKLDVVVSSLGTATSLQGGTLLETALTGADGKIYALAQGPVSIGGFEVTGRTGSGLYKNHVNAGRVPGGAIVEREVGDASVMTEPRITFVLHSPDFTTASRIAAAINKALDSEKAATVLDLSAVAIDVPTEFSGHNAEFIASLESLDVNPDRIARVVINERTGTVVAGADVRVSRAAVAHGSLIVEVQESFAASQPAPFSYGTTVVTPRTEIKGGDQPGQVHLVENTTSLADVVKVLNSLGATPRDLITILQSLAQAGALNAEVEVQ